jgi:hypothetical protein
LESSLPRRSQFLDHLPDDALIAWAGHLDIARLVRYSISRNWREARGIGSKNPQDTIIPWAFAAGFGPDWGGYLTAVRGEGSPASVDLVIGIQTRPLEAGQDRLPFAENIEPILHALLSAAVESVNGQSGTNRASIRTTNHDGGRITTVSGIVPDRPRQEFAYSVDRLGRYWLGTSAAAVEQASLIKPKTTGPRTADPFSFGSLITVNLAEWRKLAAAGPRAIDFLWEGKPLDAKSKEQQFQSLLAFSQLADRLTLAARVDESSVHLSCVLAADEQ